MFYDERSLRHVYRGCNIGRFCSYYCSCCCFDVISVVDVLMLFLLLIFLLLFPLLLMSSLLIPKLLSWLRLAPQCHYPDHAPNVITLTPPQCHYPDHAPMSLPWPRPNVITLTSPQCHYPAHFQCHYPDHAALSLPWPQRCSSSAAASALFVKTDK